MPGRQRAVGRSIGQAAALHLPGGEGEGRLGAVEETGGVADDMVVVIGLVQGIILARVVLSREEGHAGETMPLGLVLLLVLLDPLLLRSGGGVADVVAGAAERTLGLDAGAPLLLEALASLAATAAVAATAFVQAVEARRERRAHRIVLGDGGEGGRGALSLDHHGWLLLLLFLLLLLLHLLLQLVVRLVVVGRHVVVGVHGVERHLGGREGKGGRRGRGVGRTVVVGEGLLLLVVGVLGVGRIAKELLPVLHDGGGADGRVERRNVLVGLHGRGARRSVALILLLLLLLLLEGEVGMVGVVGGRHLQHGLCLSQPRRVIRVGVVGQSVLCDFPHSISQQFLPPFLLLPLRLYHPPFSLLQHLHLLLRAATDAAAAAAAAAVALLHNSRRHHLGVGRAVVAAVHPSLQPSPHSSLQLLLLVVVGERELLHVSVWRLWVPVEGRRVGGLRTIGGGGGVPGVGRAGVAGGQSAVTSGEGGGRGRAVVVRDGGVLALLVVVVGVGGGGRVVGAVPIYDVDVALRPALEPVAPHQAPFVAAVGRGIAPVLLLQLHLLLLVLLVVGVEGHGVGMVIAEVVAGREVRELLVVDLGINGIPGRVVNLLLLLGRGGRVGHASLVVVVARVLAVAGHRLREGAVAGVLRPLHLLVPMPRAVLGAGGKGGKLQLLLLRLLLLLLLLLGLGRGVDGGHDRVHVVHHGGRDGGRRKLRRHGVGLRGLRRDDVLEGCRLGHGVLLRVDGVVVLVLTIGLHAATAFCPGELGARHGSKRPVNLMTGARPCGGGMKGKEKGA